MSRLPILFLACLCSLPVIADDNDARLRFSASLIGEGLVLSDVDEDELVPDAWHQYGFSSGSGHEVKLTFPTAAGLYLNLAQMRTVTEGGFMTNRFRHASLGASLHGKPIASNPAVYGLVEAGVGGCEFESPSLDRPRHFGLAELGLEIGVQTEAGPFMGVGLKWVVIGYPTETVANSLIPKLVIGVAF